MTKKHHATDHENADDRLEQKVTSRETAPSDLSLPVRDSQSTQDACEDSGARSLTAAELARRFLEGTTQPTRNPLEDKEMRSSSLARLTYVPASPVLFLSGGPGVGKSTTADRLGELVERAAIVPLDVLYDFTLRDTSVPPSEVERRTILEGASHLSATYVRSGHQVIVEGVLPPRLVDVPRRVLSTHDVPFSVVYLSLPVDVAVRRNASREKVLPEKNVRCVHELFHPLDSSNHVSSQDSLDRVALNVWKTWCDASAVQTTPEVVS